MSSISPARRRAHSSSQLHSPLVPRAPASPLGNAVYEAGFAAGDRPYARSPRRMSASQHSLSALRTPTRSFYHRSFHGPLDPAQYSSLGLREETAELASIALSDKNSVFSSSSPPLASYDDERRGEDTDEHHPEVIREVSEPVSPEFPPENLQSIPQVSALTQLIRSSSSSGSELGTRDATGSVEEDEGDDEGFTEDTMFSLHADATEHDPLLPKTARGGKRHSHVPDDVESQGAGRRGWRSGIGKHLHQRAAQVQTGCYILTHPKTWKPDMIWQEVVMHPVSLLPAVFLGLLLNILDALSYGMILFPLGQPVFQDLGSDGIAIFYVSTIVAQVVYSSGGSIFRGGIGSEMIEVVPFFHQMAFTILNRVGEDDPRSVRATTIFAFAISAILTGCVFFLMGACGLGSLIGFFPRHILIGCIGGVGWFLVATGLEVSARLPGNLEYNLATIQQLFKLDTAFLWLVPLSLAIILLITQRFVKSNFLVGGYFISVAAVFYFFKFALDIQIETLRDRGWVFENPPAGNPWYHFYTLYDIKAVNWEALADTIPAMFALTFFGVLHVPINVPALGISTGEDNLSVDRELIAHGLSNTISGLFGSIQNYLVYTNSLLFMDSGGNDRLAGLMLAAATLGILMVGPVIIGYIPIMVVGALIFLLGIELLEEALVGTWRRVHRLEYATIIIIVVTMGAWDFVMGILVGIILAALNFVVQTSRKSAIRATYSGQVANSTVRRPPVQLRFLKEAGQQIFVIKLAGFLFFGTIVSVENRIRALLAEDAFQEQPLRYLVIDMAHINGVDFSAAEAFTRINRLLRKKDVQLVVSGLGIEGEISQSLRNVGLFGEVSEVEIFASLNEALEFCENDLLKALYRRQEQLKLKRASSYLEVPRANSQHPYPTEVMFSSPRRDQLHRMAVATLDEVASEPRKWQALKQPLPLMLQIFEGISSQNEDFWHRATPFFERVTFPKGSIIFNIGDVANGFYLIEEGLFHADYDLPQGRYTELIVAGRPCGELPFFSETQRTATMTADKDSVAWRMDIDRWTKLQRLEADVAQELLKISLKLTKERMDAVTSYVLTTAG